MVKKDKECWSLNGDTVACSMEHLITNLVVPQLHLTCFREMEMTQQYITLLAGRSTLVSCVINLLQIRSTCCVSRCHVVVDPLLEVTSWRFGWRWEQLNPNTLWDHVVTKIHYITKLTWLLEYLLTFHTLINGNYLSLLLMFGPRCAYGQRASPVPPVVRIIVPTNIAKTF